eukprot:408722-Prymnesium_polylepis.1
MLEGPVRRARPDLVSQWRRPAPRRQSTRRSFIVLLLLHYVCAPVAPPVVLTAIAMGFTLTL